MNRDRRFPWPGLGSEFAVADILRGLALTPRHFITRLGPQLGVKRLRAETDPAAGFDPEQINGTPGKAVACPPFVGGATKACLAKPHGARTSLREASSPQNLGCVGINI